MQFDIVKNIFVLAFLMYESLYDIKKKTVSLMGVLVFCLVALATMFFEFMPHSLTELPWSLMQRMAVGVVVLAAGKITGDAIGAGDGLILIGIGIVSGGRSCLLTLMMAGLLAFFVALILLAAGKVNRKSRIPFVPFLTAGWLITILSG